MATNDIGRVTPIWQGVYDPERAYELNDIVITSDCSVWWHVSEDETTGVTPADGETWAPVIDMRIFSANIREAIDTAQQAVRDAQEAEAGVDADVRRAETAASGAESSARTAQSAANSAGAYSQAAQTAKTEAETAQTAAERARDDASASKTAAQSARDAAQSAKTAAQTAQTAAETAQGAAQTARTGAETARTGAEDALAATREVKAAALEEIAEDLAGAVETIEATREAEVEAAETAIEAKGSATLATIPADYSELYDYSLLHVDEINGTVQSVVYKADGSVDRIEHRAIVGNGLVRSDAYTFTDSSVTEVRTLASGASLTLTTDYNTLNTTVVYTAAE